MFLPEGGELTKRWRPSVMTDSRDDVIFILQSDWLFSDDVTDAAIEAVIEVRLGLSIEGLGRISSSSASAMQANYKIKYQ